MKVKISGHPDNINRSNEIHNVIPTSGGYWLKAINKKGDTIFYISPECPVVELKRD